MTSQTYTLNTKRKHGIARFLGILFIFSALMASALTVLLPRGSSAASSAITVAPDADTYVRQSTAGPEERISGRRSLPKPHHRISR